MKDPRSCGGILAANPYQMYNQRLSHCAEVSLQLEPYTNSGRFIEISPCHCAAYTIRRVNIWFGLGRDVLTILLNTFNLCINVRIRDIILENNNI